jgi:proline racemase
MRFERMVQVVDSHTMGEATRVITGGVAVYGKTMAEKREYLWKHQDLLRQQLMLEPRGHDDMVGAILTDPVHPEAQYGVVFMDSGGYLNMCGHGIIGVTVVTLETGMIPCQEGLNAIAFDTPAGLIKVEAVISNDQVMSVTFENAPAFLFKENYEFQLSDGKTLKADIAFGGSFFAIVNSRDLGIRVEPEYSYAFLKYGSEIRETLNNRIGVEHPEHSHINTIDLVEFYDQPSHPEAQLKNVVFFGNGQLDRSPCGTGTTAKLAALYHKKKIGIGEEFVHESILGTLFSGEIVGEARIKKQKALRIKITGNAYITGFSQLVVDADDPLKQGFTLRK